MKSNYTVTVSHIVILFLILTGISWFSVDEIRSYVSSLGLLIIPFVVGFSIYLIVKKVKSSEYSSKIRIRQAFGWWIVGVIFLTVACSIVSVIVPVLTISAGLSIGAVCLVFSLIFGRKTEVDVVFNRKSVFSVVVLAIGILVAYWYIERIFVFPLMLGGDLTGHVADLSAISSGLKGIGLFDDAFILLIGIASYTAGSKPLLMFWSGPLIQYAILAIGIYLLSRKVLRNYYAPLFAALVPLWFMGDGIMNDPIFFLRRNVLLALIPFFILCLLTEDSQKDSGKTTSKPSIPFLISGFIPIYYYFAISNAFYISTVSKLPFFAQVLFQPGFAFTIPALTFDMPIARIQDLFVLTLSTMFLLLLLRMSKPSERKAILSWAIISLIAILINYRMGLMIAVIFFVFVLLKTCFSSRAFSFISVTSLGIIGFALAGINLVFDSSFKEIYNSVSNIIFQTNGVVWSIQQKNSFLLANYGWIFILLTAFSILYLSFAASKISKTLSGMTAITGLSLALYFLPFPSSERFLVFVTPLAVILILVCAEKMWEGTVNLEKVREKNVVEKKPNRRRSVKSYLNLTRNVLLFHPKALGAFALIILILIGAFSITGPYNSSINNYTSMYGNTGSISSFTQSDIDASQWFKEHMPSETIIISDPATVQILCGLAEMPYTLRGRYFVQGLDTLSIVSGRSDLFKNILLSFDSSSLAELRNLFTSSDNFRGLNVPNRKIVAVFNNRTTAWLAGLSGYEYSSSFYQTQSLDLFERSFFSKSLYNSSSTYLMYEITTPVLTTKNGPELNVQYGNSSIRSLQTTMTYFVPTNPNFTLSISGSNHYTIDGIPKQWLLDSIVTTGSSKIGVTQSNDGSLIMVNNSTPDNNISLQWSFLPSGNVSWKIVNWQSGWQQGPYSNPKAGTLQFSDVNGMLEMNVGIGIKDGYSSILRTDFSLPLNQNTRLQVDVNGTRNTKLAIAIDLIDGQRVFLFNNTLVPFFPVIPQFRIFEYSWTFSSASQITGIQIFILSTDGAPCQSFIKYFIAVE
jgi:hypothetical protein